MTTTRQKGAQAKRDLDSIIEPDGCLIFDRLVLLPEIDMGTEDEAKWASKLCGTSTARPLGGRFRFFSPYVEPLYPFFFPNERVMLKVKGWIQAAGGRVNFWLGTFDALDPRSSLTTRSPSATIKQTRTLSGKLLQTWHQTA